MLSYRTRRSLYGLRSCLERITKLCFCLILGSCFLVSCAPSACERAKRERYLIPDGYSGWLCITYGVPEAQPLPMEDGFRLVKFEQSCTIVTSSAQMPGHDYYDEFYFYSGNTRRLLRNNELGGGYTVSQEKSKTPSITYKFWVSKNVSEDYQLYVKGKDSSCGPFKKE